MKINRLILLLIALTLFIVPALAQAFTLEETISRANDGYFYAQYLLGLRYLQGDEVEQDTEKALYWLNKSTKDEYVANYDAASLLGDLYYYGRLLPQDYEKAVLYYKIAAERLEFESMGALAALYFLGRGTEVDLEQSYFWFSAASQLLSEHGQTAKVVATKLDKEVAERIAIEAEAWVNENFWGNYLDILEGDQKWDIYTEED